MEHLRKILFIDIETVSCQPEYEMMSAGMQEQWDRKARFLKSATDENASPSQLFTEKAGIFSEFAKVVCIGIGCLVEKNKQWKLVLKSLTGTDEKVLLNQFAETLSKFTYHHPDMKFCGHNIREFDLPFLCRRMIINNISIPEPLQLQGKKPWEVNIFDTLEMWKFGDYKHFTSLALLAEVLGIPSPKDDIDGSMVGEVFWKENNLPRIARYCLQDVATTAKIYLRLSGNKDVDFEKEFVEE
jgi:DNA polymerase elongation subunit (family B)